MKWNMSKVRGSSGSDADEEREDKEDEEKKKRVGLQCIILNGCISTPFNLYH